MSKGAAILISTLVGIIAVLGSYIVWGQSATKTAGVDEPTKSAVIEPSQPPDEVKPAPATPPRKADPAPAPPKAAPSPARAPSSAVRLEVRGEVAQEIYISGIGGGGASPYAYHVRLTTRNTGTTPFTYDESEAAFAPLKGTPLRMTTRRTDKDDEKKALIVTIPPGSEETHDFSSDGYTGNLLRDAGTERLRFMIRFYLKDKAVSNYYVTILPEITGLPQFEEVGPGKGVRLPFIEVE